MFHCDSRENVAWASTCNSVGQTAGYFLSNVVFLALESKDFANRYVRQPLNLPMQSTGLVTLPGFLLFWGIVFGVSTTLVALMKNETDESNDSDEPHFGLIETYRVLLKVLRLPSVRSMALILLTIKVRSLIFIFPRCSRFFLLIRSASLRSTR